MSLLAQIGRTQPKGVQVRKTGLGSSGAWCPVVRYTTSAGAQQSSLIGLILVACDAPGGVSCL